MKYKLLLFFACLFSFQVKANDLQSYNVGVNEYKETKSTNDIKLYSSLVLGANYKFLSGGVEQAGNKLFMANSLYSPLMGFALGIVFDKVDSLFQEIRVAGEVNIAHNSGFSISKINGTILEKGTESDTSTSVMLNNYWNFNDISNFVSVYFSIGMGIWGRYMVSNTTDTVSAFAGKFGLGITKKINDLFAIDVGIYNLTTTQFGFNSFVMRENEFGVNFILRKVF